MRTTARTTALLAATFLLGTFVTANVATGDEPEPIPPVVDVEPPPADWTPTYPDQAVNDWQADGFAIYEPETFPTLPDAPYDECWSDDGTTKLASGEFVIYNDARTWGTHSVGGMRCGPADVPMPAPIVEPQPAVATATSSCEP